MMFLSMRAPRPSRLCICKKPPRAKEGGPSSFPLPPRKGGWGSWPSPFPVAAFRKLGSTSHLGSTVELTLLTGWSAGYLPGKRGSERSGSPPHPPYGGGVGGEIPLIFSAPCSLWQVGKLSCLSQAAALRRVDPAPHLGNTIELALKV